MKFEIQTQYLKTTDTFGVLIYSLISHLEKSSPFGCMITQVEIAETLHIGKSTVSQRIKELKEKGLLDYSKRYSRFKTKQSNT